MKKTKINVGLVGYGVIGEALGEWIKKNNPNCQLLISDPPKGHNQDLSNADIIFISIHIPTESDGSQNLTLLESIIKKLPQKPIFIRTTVLPGTCDKLSKKFNKSVNFLPEFLTERSATTDFEEQAMVFTNNVELLSAIFVGKKYITMSSMEAELAKYAHNVFGTLKVTYFNGIYKLAKKLKCDYENVKQGVLLSGVISTTRTHKSQDTMVNLAMVENVFQKT